MDKQRLREQLRRKSSSFWENADLRPFVSIDEGALKILQLKKRFKTQVVHELTEKLQEELYDLKQQYDAV